MTFVNPLTIIKAENEDLTNLEQLYNQAVQKPQTYAVGDSVPVVTLTDDQNNSYQIEAYKIDSSDNCESYVMAIPTALLNDTPTTYASGSGSDSGYDNSYSVYASITYNYTTSSANGNVGYLLTSVSGSWQIKDSSVSITSREVIYACTGLTLSGTINSSQYVTKYPTSNSFSYSSGFSAYVINDQLLSTLGTTSTATLKHGSSSTWTLTVNAKKF